MRKEFGKHMSDQYNYRYMWSNTGMFHGKNTEQLVNEKINIWQKEMIRIILFGEG